MKKITLYFFLCIVAIKANAQNTFQTLYGGTNAFDAEVHDAQKTADGGYILTGVDYYYGPQYNDPFLLKINSSGALQWIQIYAETNNGYGFASQAAHVEQTADGGYILAGSTYSIIGLDDAYFLKTDSLGNIQWYHVYGSPNWEAVASVHQTSTGEYIAAGYTQIQPQGTLTYKNIYALKLSGAGDIVWTNTYDNNINNDDEAFAVHETGDGNYIIGGTSTVGSPAHQAAALLKLNSSDGSVIWSKTYGQTTADMVGYDMKQTADGGFIITGTNSNDSATTNNFLLKIDATGNTVQFAETYATTDATDNETAHSVTATADGGYALFGDVLYNNAPSYNRYGLLIKTDNAGNVTWNKRYGQGSGVGYGQGSEVVGGGDYGRTVLQSADNGYLLGSYEIYDFGFTGYTGYVIKTDSSGNSGCNDTALSIITTSPIVVAGAGLTASTSGSTTGNETVTAFVPDAGYFPVTVLCQFPDPNLKFSSFDGTNKPASQFGGTSFGNTINTGKNILKWTTSSEVVTDFYRIQRSNDRINFSIIGNKVNATAKTHTVVPYKFTDDNPLTGTNYYRIKGVSIKGKITYSRIIRIKTPNVITMNSYGKPGMFMVKSEQELNVPFLEYRVFNSLGSKVFQGRIQNNSGKILSTIDLSFLSSGVYFVSFNSTEGVTNQKIVIAH
ncbi:MAG: T9SS type A sorting domain-containing protein [Chitinophagaceae bacterium]